MIDFSRYVNHNGLPEFTEEEWVTLNEEHGKDKVRHDLQEHLILNNVPFPLREYTEEETRAKFLKFAAESQLPHVDTAVDPNDVAEKYEYKYNFKEHGFAIITARGGYNHISNYFMQAERYDCGTHSGTSPIQTWNTPELLRKFNWTFWRGVRGNDGVRETNYRGAFRLGSYIATQFKPAVAKAIYEYYNAKVICDTSCGWGDRLTGFFATPGAEQYYGCDPNPKVYEIYKEMCRFYSDALQGPLFNEGYELIEHEDWFEFKGAKYVRIYNRPAEDMHWAELGIPQFDLMFTSPPYFSTERYGRGEEKEDNQSWKRYNNYEQWREGFYFPMLNNVDTNTKPGGNIIVNIWNPNVKGKIYPACDELVDFMIKQGIQFSGQMGMRISFRPKKTEQHQELLDMIGSKFVENIWCFTKINKSC